MTNVIPFAILLLGSIMTDDKWEELKESWHRKNMNKLYLKLKLGEPLEFTDIERRNLCNALSWAGEEIGGACHELFKNDEYLKQPVDEFIIRW